MAIKVQTKQTITRVTPISKRTHTKNANTNTKTINISTTCALEEHQYKHKKHQNTPKHQYKHMENTITNTPTKKLHTKNTLSKCDMSLDPLIFPKTILYLGKYAECSSFGS